MSECVLWTGHVGSNGYGHVRTGNAHRAAYAKAHGAIPAGMDVHHRCGQPLCVNVEHLELIEHGEHARQHNPRCEHGDAERNPSGSCNVCARERNARRGGWKAHAYVESGRRTTMSVSRMVRLLADPDGVVRDGRGIRIAPNSVRGLTAEMLRREHAAENAKHVFTREVKS